MNPQPKKPRGKDRAYLDWIARLSSCATCGAPGTYHEETGEYLLTPSHLKSRGSGGPDRKNTIPQCIKCHGMVHTFDQDWLAGLACLHDITYTKKFEEAKGGGVDRASSGTLESFCQDSSGSVRIHRHPSDQAGADLGDPGNHDVPPFPSSQEDPVSSCTSGIH